MNIEDLYSEAENLRRKNNELQQALATSSFQSREDGNLIQFQLDTGEMLSRLEHFLKGDYLTIDADGNEIYKEQEDEDLILFNDYGVNSIMAIIGSYMDRNTLLSYYDVERVNEILGDLGDELAIFIYCNYEKNN